MNTSLDPQSPAPDRQPAIRAVGLRKTFGETVAVADLNLAVAEGEIFGLVGPDGAGKTTAIRLLLALLAPDAGEVRIGGYDLRRQPREARAIVGYVPQQFALYGDLSVAENMRFVAEVRGLEPQSYARRAHELLALAGLAPFTERLARDLSGGMRQKLSLLSALLHQPRILLLDEPTTGVDPVSRRDFWRLLYPLAAQGVALLISTPYLDEAQRCHRLGFMVAGRLLAVDTPEGLLRRMPDALIEIRTEERIEARRLLRQRREVRRVEVIGGALRVAFDPHAPDLDAGRALCRWLAEQGIPVAACEPATATLADVFSALSDSSGGSP
ncbi:MAG: ABC transporter ATP-binding protein [Armatimonadetes bacterium]|nr:ABC transporter ATP-binding protein [Armatimonadota bacterium]